MNIQKVRNFLASQGYIDITIEEQGRHFAGIIFEGDKALFFKMEQNPAQSDQPSIKSEIAWNLKLSQRLNPTMKVKIPTVIDHGVIDGKHYIITPYYEGRLLCQKFAKATPAVQVWFPAIVSFDLALERLSLIDMGMPEVNAGQLNRDFVTKTKGWLEDLQSDQQDKLYWLTNFIGRSDNRLWNSVNHGDLTPWHLVVEGDHLVVIDAEHGMRPKSKYYDVVFFAHRLATQCYGLDLAKAYLKLFRTKLDMFSQEEFELALNSIMASRIIGGFWDAKNDDTALEPHYALLATFRERKL